MRLILLAIFVGLGLGAATGGRLRSIGERHVTNVALLVGGVVVQAVSAQLDGAAGVAALLTSLALLLAFAVRNLHLAGMELLATGLALNLLVIGMNGGMPVRRDALRAAGADAAEIEGLRDAKHHLERPSDKLLLLSDTVGVAPLREVVSAGDLGIGLGVIVVLVGLMRANPRPRRRRR